MNKSAFIKALDLTGGNLLEIMIGAKETEARYDAALNTIKEKVEPVLWDYLKGKNVRELVESKATPAELEEMQVEMHPEGFSELLATTVDAMDFTVAGKSYLYGIWMQALTDSSIRYFQEMMRIRMEILVRKEKKRLITLP